MKYLKLQVRLSSKIIKMFWVFFFLALLKLDYLVTIYRMAASSMRQDRVYIYLLSLVIFLFIQLQIFLEHLF